MVEVEASQEVLVGLALPAVLSGYQSRHDLEHLTHSGSWLLLDLPSGDHPFGGRIRREKRFIGLSRYAYFW